MRYNKEPELTGRIVLPLQTWQGYTVPEADERLTPTLLIESGQQTLLLMQGVFLGSAKELRHLLRPLLQAGSPRRVIIEEISWLEAVDKFVAISPSTPFPFKSVAPYVYHLLPDEGIATIQRFISKPPTSRAIVFFHGLGGAVAKVPNQATAYFYRKSLSAVEITASWSEPDGAAPGINWVEDFRKALLPFTKGNYVNAPDLSIEDWPRAYYGRNFERLTRIKAKYDPENIFRYPQSIPPAYDNCQNL